MGDKKDDDYDPHLHREVPSPTNNFESMLHIMKGILGTGILAMPEVFKNSGIIMGFVWSIMNGGLSVYGIHLLVKSQYRLCKKFRIPMLTYADSLEKAFQEGPDRLKKISTWGRCLVHFFLITYQVGACCVYILFVGFNVKMVCDEMFSKTIALQMYIATMIVPFILINSVKNLKLMVPFSFFANAVTFMTVIVIFVFIFRDDVPSLGDRYMLPPDKLKLMLAYGTTSFAFQSVAVVTSTENNMKTPKSFGGMFGVYNRSMYILFVLYLSIGFLGYWKYGDATAASVTLNFPPADTLTKVANLLYAVAIYISYGLNGYIPIQIIYDEYLVKHIEESQCKIMWEFLIRIFEVFLTMCLAVSIPMLGQIISLLGAFCLSFLGIIFPGIIDICSRHPDNYGKGNWIYYKDVLLIFYGVVGLICGCIICVREIVLAFMANKY